MHLKDCSAPFLASRTRYSAECADLSAASSFPPKNFAIILLLMPEPFGDGFTNKVNDIV